MDKNCKTDIDPFKDHTGPFISKWSLKKQFNKNTQFQEIFLKKWEVHTN